MSLGFLLLVIIGIALIILMIWNLYSIKELKIQGKRDRRLDDPRYFELKYKQEFFIATVSLVGTVLVVFGYNSLQNVENALKDEFANKTVFLSKRTDSIMQNFDDSLSDKILGTNLKLDTISTSSSKLLSETSSQLFKAQKSISAYNKSLLELSFQQKEVDNQFKVVQNRINEVNSKNILKLTYFIVDSLLFDTRIMDTAHNEEAYFMQYYFKDMRNIYGDKLPKFSKPPFILTSVDNTPLGVSTGTIKEITTESFKFNLSSWSDKNRIYRFSILIFEKP